MGPATWEGAVKEEKVPHTRKPLHWWKREVGGWGSFGATDESAATGVEEGKAERFPHRGSVLTSICGCQGRGKYWTRSVGLADANYYI